ncbi:MAG: lysophospholipid acyltransferase family protein [Candidatus Cloacimonetes bacterium]|jgi:1-acyl-sn-glycerol-3-phosphate acyltransferase|nr:1-acyl-sn-glycerol-3-phosphate acyltransferase [Candidatus Cloacimonadota bacterium]MDD3386835.1 lysophospholipid acyltransferase family protein [Candidatus Paceibacterota bacterium]MDD4156670.1 lysophospholipid acyltransferase family protein [Candidatus Cloacimonadota bacterium]
MRCCWHYKLVNKNKLKDVNSVIIASNHISWFDPPFIASILPFEITFLAKAELCKYSLAAKIFNWLNVIPIYRGRPDKGAIEKSINTLNNNKSLLIFPQGTRNGSKIKPGIGLFMLNTKHNILPIYIENANKFFSCFFFIKRLKIVFGDVIPYTQFAELETNREAYQLISEYTFKKINELQNEKN